MKNLFFILFFIAQFSFKSLGQEIDSLAIKQIDSLINASRNLTGTRNFPAALEVNAIAEKLAIQKFGKESAFYGSVCFNHGRILYFKLEYSEAEKYYLESKVIREKVLGKEHSDYAWSLHNLAVLYWRFEDYKKAEPYYLDAKKIWQKSLGDEDTIYAMCLNNLAVLYIDMGNYEKVEPLILEAIKIRKAILGDDHPDYAQSIGVLATFYHYLCNYEKAVQYYLEAKIIREKVLGKEHTEYAKSLNDLSNLYLEIGNYESAETYSLQANMVFEKVLGKEHPEYAMSLMNLAHFYWKIGNYINAESLYLEAKSIREKIFGKVNPISAATNHDLAILYVSLDSLEKAELLYLEAKDIWEIEMGKENADYATILTNLAVLYLNMGKFKKAESLFLESKAIQDKLLNKGNNDYANTIGNLGLLYRKMGKYEMAESLFLEIKVIKEKALGKEHPDYGNVIENLVDLYMAMHKYETAESLLLELNSIREITLRKALSFMSERELHSHIKQFSLSRNKIFSYSHQMKSINSGQICYNNSLLFKGFLINATTQIYQLALSDSITLEKFNMLKSYERSLVNELTRPISDRKNVDSLEARANNLQKQLTKLVTPYGELMKQVHWKEVQQKLKTYEAAIEFVHFLYINSTNVMDSILYAALILLPGDSSPQFVTLFEEKELKVLLSFDSIRREEYVANLYQPYLYTENNSNSDHHKSLYELIWKPIESKLRDVKTIYFSPSGFLHLINQNAISINNKIVLSDRYNLVQLGTTRQLVVNDKSFSFFPNSAYLIGGVNFDTVTTAIDTAIKIKKNTSLTHGTELKFSFTDSSYKVSNWEYLIGTKKEIKMIQTIFKKAGIKSTTLEGSYASEDSFKQMSNKDGTSPKVLHIATHGYFYSDPKKNAKRISINFNGEEIFKRSNHPMIRSGLILSGANHAWVTGKPLRPEMDDGILTAYEICQLNLRNTELVVLSACETGLGKIEGNEGVYGLQRAFKIAGVNNLIMSLWEVPDNQTSELMTLFYKNWLINRMTIRKSLLAAQDKLRKDGWSAFYWAGFVLVE